MKTENEHTYYHKRRQSLGFRNETEIMQHLNGKHLWDLPLKWKKHILYMNPNAHGFTKIKCNYAEDKNAKVDLVIKIGSKDYYVSIKSGTNPSMHQEYYVEFLSFLKNIGIDSQDVAFLKFYHFGESYKTRANHEPVYSKDELVTKYRAFLDRFNSHMVNKDQLLKIINRTVIQGADPTRRKIDFLYYGSYEHGFLWSRDDIIKNAMQDIGSTEDGIPPHFGKLNYQPSGRKLDTDDRNYSRVKWPLLSRLYYTIGTDIHDEEDEEKDDKDE